MRVYHGRKNVKIMQLLSWFFRLFFYALKYSNVIAFVLNFVFVRKERYYT